MNPGDQITFLFLAYVVIVAMLITGLTNSKTTQQDHSIPYCFSKAHGMALPCMYKSGETDA